MVTKDVKAVERAEGRGQGMLYYADGCASPLAFGADQPGSAGQARHQRQPTTNTPASAAARGR